MTNYYVPSQRSRHLTIAQQPEPQTTTRNMLMWHDAVHEREGSTLTFWRLSFGPRYNRDEIFDDLEEFYATAGIRSHIAYETLGEFDLLLRLWVPRGPLAGEVESSLRSHLSRHDVWDVQHMFSTQNAHWTARDRLAPTQGIDEVYVSNATISSINAFNDRQVAGADDTFPEGVQSLIAANLLVPIDLDERGIRFYIALSRPFRALNPGARNSIFKRLEQECSTAQKDFRTANPEAPPGHISIYSGNGGTFTDYLLLGRAPHSYFHEFIRHVALVVRGMDLVDEHGMRPHTYVLANQMFAECTEHRQALSVEQNDLESLKLRDESQTLEYKATFSVNLRRMLFDGGLHKSDDLIDAVARTVCGMLNSDEGGILILGVLEVDREYAAAQKHSDKRAGELLARLSQAFGYEPEITDGAVTRPLPNLTTGIELEYGSDGPYESADVFFRAVRDALRDRIEPTPWPWIRMEAVPEDGRTIAVISVTPSDTWCYAKLGDGSDEAFFVREAASTRKYSARERDLYQRAHARD